ncbi:hypothetical protein HPP92_021854 [Vanilla planifolia]|uniref:Uncharacterized protein n=1 Tax=Vanilla planifolia TaxID=51239 RepID=A0A835PVY9_VANPL|nr:hypothetical protein HPP92_022174 [Vanilla planifolia]KAG0458726.1 hypothetical protein HPP92_021854 [Vanilla planifolia]
MAKRDKTVPMLHKKQGRIGYVMAANDQKHSAGIRNSMETKRGQLELCDWLLCGAIKVQNVSRYLIEKQDRSCISGRWIWDTYNPRTVGAAYSSMPSAIPEAASFRAGYFPLRNP